MQVFSNVHSPVAVGATGGSAFMLVKSWKFTGGTPAPAACAGPPAVILNDALKGVLNQTAHVHADGTWTVPNVPANMGPVRARVTCVGSGTHVFAASHAAGLVDIKICAFSETLSGLKVVIPRDRR
jgi:hypothetical protein